MDRGEVVRLGLLPEFNYARPSCFNEEETTNRVGRKTVNIGNGRRTASAGVSSRATTSPSMLSSSDMKEDVLRVLRRRYGRRKNTSDSFPSPAASSDIWSGDALWANGRQSRRDEVPSPAGTVRISRKRTWDVEDQEGAPKPKISRTEHNATGGDSGVNGHTHSRNTGETRSVNGVRSNVNQCQGQTEPNVTDSEMPTEFDDEHTQTHKTRRRLRPVYRRRSKKTALGDDAMETGTTQNEDEEDLEDALSTFKASQMYECRRAVSLMKSIGSGFDQRGDTTKPASTMLAPVSICFTVPTIAVVPSVDPLSSVGVFPPPSTFAVSSTPSFSTLPISEAPAAPVTYLGPVTTVTWSTGVSAPIAAVQPLSTSVSSMPADVSVSVTIPFLTSTKDTTVSSTLRLPTTTTTAASANGTVATAGFNFTFTGQPVGVTQFNFANLDPSTNIFSSVGSAESVVRRKPAAQSSYSSRRRHR